MAENREELKNVCKKGDITLVLGAGVSRSVGFPNWEELARRVWDRAFPTKASPWDDDESKSPQQLPQFLPIIFERVFHKLGKEEFVTRIQEHLYEGVEELSKWSVPTSSSTLSVLARVVVQEFKAGDKRRIKRIITLNADDSLESATSSLLDQNKKKPLKTIATPMVQPEPDGRIPCYHIHGFVPNRRDIPFGFLLKGEQRKKSQKLLASAYRTMMIFTDSQYWQSASTVLSFANRTMGAALHDSRCVFIGLSMTDLNILRWLALRQSEIEQVEESKQEILTEIMGEPKTRLALFLKKGIDFLHSQKIRGELGRHYWIRPKDTDPSGFLTDFLELRGVRSVEISSWNGRHFVQLMKVCFPPHRKPQKQKTSIQTKDGCQEKGARKKSRKKKG